MIRVIIFVFVIIVIIILALLVGSYYSNFVVGGSENRFPQWIIDISRKKKNSLDYSLFETIGEKTLYSSLMPWHVDSVDAALKKEFEYSSPETIIDATAHVGIDSSNFLKLFPDSNLLSFEIDPEVFRALQSNARSIIREFGLKDDQFVVKNESSVGYLMRSPSADLIYLDPPWGGRGGIPTHLGDKKLTTIVKKALKNAKVVIIKLPRYADIEKFIHSVKKSKTCVKIYPIEDDRKEKLSYYLLAFGNLPGC